MQVLDSAKYDAVVIGVHNYSFRPANNYGISPAALGLWQRLQQRPAATFIFGNVYAANAFASAKTLVALHQDDAAFQHAAADFLRGGLTAIGRLPVSVASFKYGSSMAINNLTPVGTAAPWLRIDSIVARWPDPKSLSRRGSDRPAGWFNQIPQGIRQL
jgi:hypothetical protein